jgi:hypothetical protein
LKLIYKAKDITEAHIIAGMLTANGVRAHVSGHYLQGGIGDLAAFDFAHIYVVDEDVSLALSLIAEYEGKPKPETDFVTEDF